MFAGSSEETNSRNSLPPLCNNNNNNIVGTDGNNLIVKNAKANFTEHTRLAISGCFLDVTKVNSLFTQLF